MLFDHIKDFLGFFLAGCNNFFFLLVKRERGWQTFKRPGVDAFLEHLAQFYEIVVYSDQSNMVIYSFQHKLNGRIYKI